MKIEIEESALETMKVMVQRLQDERDMLLKAAKLGGIDSTDKLEAFAALIRAATKEEDAKICESMEIPEFVHGAHPDYLDGKQMAFGQAATAIRESK